MAHLDGLDDLALTLGACNCVHSTPDGKPSGTNTDWRGSVGCLVDASDECRGRERGRMR